MRVKVEEKGEEGGEEDFVLLEPMRLHGISVEGSRMVAVSKKDPLEGTSQWDKSPFTLRDWLAHCFKGGPTHA